MSGSEGVFLSTYHIAMFCKDCGIAFGPVFDSEEEADSFLLWFESPDRVALMEELELPDVENMRHWDPADLAQLYHEWKERANSRRLAST